MSVEVKGLDQVVKNLSRYPAEVLRGAVAVAQAYQAVIVNDAKADHPYKDRTGNLTDSIQPGMVEITDDEVSAYVEARMQYATYVEFGTSRAAAYPFLVPAMLRQATNYKNAMANAVSRIRL